MEVDDDVVRVRMGFAFRAQFPRASITDVRSYWGVVGGVGVHGWRGRWLVNGSATGLVTMEINAPGRARVLGIPVQLRNLRVSVESPEELVAFLRG